ncbi:aspartate aminotransferase family protein [Clostridium magnum]|uniref:Acetylornithine aminotransferase n=1 Tax=Clostridium magnum DSM 2767 TaxID=1121326 RepID=A0A162SI39_9CLOT|nr:aspartate aminotransferase family protein [Clostridium magnum]KZL91294.1 acetylornithine aminotransferase [Clostridium magnum DSM 2767]SHI36500.1 acetylornithine aminotransferase apoenzyme [Clostridium magnum DSM 2767]
MSKENIMHTYGRFDVTFENGMGSRLFDTKGKEYIDFVSGVAVNCLGHSHPAIINAINEQSKKLIHISNYYWNTQHSVLAEKLCNYSDHNSVFFCNSGTEAIEGAIKIARKYGKIKGSADKNIIIYMKNSFHGRTMGALAVTGQGKYQKDFVPLMGGARNVNINDIEELRSIFNENVCAVIIEPIQGEGGINSASIEYLRECRALCDKHNALLIFDEVQCGIGRLGTLFAYKKFEVIPDLICLAKALAGGLPIGAIVANERASILQPGDHGSTFGGNPLVCAVANAVIDELTVGGVISSIEEKSKYFVNRLNEINGKLKFINEIRGSGLLLGLKINIDVKTFINKCFEKGLLVVSAGPEVVRLLPPLNVTVEEIDNVVNIFEAVASELC